jgi:hypothetical protein
MIRRAALTIALALATGDALAQLRTIPADAKRATLSSLGGMQVEVDGKKLQLAAGAQIRDARNMIVLPTTVPPGVRVKFLVDAQGQVIRVWILSPQEAEQPDAGK